VVLPILTQPHCFYSYTFCLPPSLIFTLVRTAASRFSLTHIVIFSLTHSLLHSISLSCSCSHWYVVFLTCCSPLLLSLSFVVSFTPFLHSLVLVDFVWVDFRLLVLLSLSTRDMVSYLCMLGMLSGCLYHRFRVSKIFGRKNFKRS